MTKKTFTTYLNALIPMIFWAFSFVWVKEAYESFGPVTTIFLRLVTSSILIFSFLKFSGRLTRIERKDIWLFITLAFFEPFLYFMGESFGLKLVSSTLASIIVSTTPLFSSILASFFYKERLTVINFLGIILSFFGIGIMIFEKGFILIAPLNGILLMMLAVFSSVCYSMFLKKLSHSYSPVNIIAYQNFIGTFMFLPVFLFMEARDFSHIQFKPNAIIAVIELSVFASSIAFILYTKAIKELGVAKSGMFINIIPVFTAIFAWIMLDEAINLQKLTGILIVISGLFVSQIKKRKNAV